MRGSPLKKCWKPGMDDGESHYLIVIDDDAATRSDLSFLGYVLNNISSYTYENAGSNTNPLQRHLFWKNIRGYIEIHYRRASVENTRVRLFQSKLYEYALWQEEMFQKIEL